MLANTDFWHSWDDTYAEDLSRTPPEPDLPLSGWFSDVNASSKILKYLSSPWLGLDKHCTTFLDLGTGNGEMLFLLRQEGGFEGPMTGVDYSPQSVELCRTLAANRGIPEEAMKFRLWDIMDSEAHESLGVHDVVLDKGTFDAISLSQATDRLGKRICEGYSKRVEPLIKEDGLLLVTSCNWTESELKRWFEHENLEPVDRIEYPVFSFGGQTGQSVCSVCFRKKSKT